MFLLEANQKPSDLKKYKTTERTEKVRFKSGDIYDLHDDGYVDDFTYYDGSGNGYIKDKEGHVYDVVASMSNGDAGRIAGGSTNYYVCIKKANGKDDFIVKGYTAIFSSGSNTSCIEDIKRGYYLEDYIAKYYNKYDHGDKFKELADKGNANAKPYETQKVEDKAAKIEEFKQRYLPIPKYIRWEIGDNGFKILDWTPGKSDELTKKREQNKKIPYWAKDESGRNIENPEYKKAMEETKEIQDKLDDILLAKFKPMLIDRISEVFKTKDINSLKGIAGDFKFTDRLHDFGTKKMSNYDYIKPAIDTKTKNIVVVAMEVAKVMKEDVKFDISDTIVIDKSKMSAKMKDLFTEVAKAWKKAYGRSQTKYVEDHWYNIWTSTKTWTYGEPKISKAEAKDKAVRNFRKMINDHDFENGPTKLEFSLALIQVYVQGDMDPEQGPVEKPLEDPTPSETKERGKNTKMNSKAHEEAYKKMQDWHDGKRKQNVGACSDAKLKMNWQVCKELGFDKETAELEAEAKKRGIVLEKLTLNEIVELFESED